MTALRRHLPVRFCHFVLFTVAVALVLLVWVPSYFYRGSDVQPRGADAGGTDSSHWLNIWEKKGRKALEKENGVLTLTGLLAAAGFEANGSRDALHSAIADIVR